MRHDVKALCNAHASKPHRTHMAAIGVPLVKNSRLFSSTAPVLLLALAGLNGCAVVSVAGAAAGAAISVTGAVVSTGVSVTGKVVEKTIDIVTPSKDAKSD